MEEKKHHINWEQQWLEGKISSKEAAQKAAVDDFDAFEKFIEGAKQLDVPSNKSKATAWQELETKISATQHSPKVISISRRNWMIGVAASFILALGAFFLLPSAENIENNQSYVATGLAESRTIYLPDSSAVHLNAVSSVSFSKEEWEENRVLSLEGEAFFEVKRGSKFSVQTSLGTVTVLGTSFNVRERDGELVVACKTGKVGVSKKASEEMHSITPGEMIAITKGEFSEVEEISTNRVASWRNKEFDFESMSLSAVFSELERQYDITITNEFDEATLEEPLSATLPTNDLDGAIQLLELIKSIEAEFSEDGKTISFIRK